MDSLRLLETNVAAGPLFGGPGGGIEAGQAVPVRLIAYYLPQFHPIPENDAWWGKGFTEWTNVTKALPQFADHYQPRLPGELGFYDLRLPEVLRRQAELAKEYGLGGFCFHYYWFSGRRLLEKPLETLLADPSIDIPFCINWANESWSRTWDGSETDVLIRQEYRLEDEVAFCEAVLPLFEDPRYITVGGRPLLMVYRPSAFPDAAATVENWRRCFERLGVNPFIVMAQVFGDNDPRRYGMDAAAGFPPHNGGFEAPRVEAQLERLNPEFTGTVVRYEDVASRTLANTSSEFRQFPGVCPQWDCTARKRERGFAVHGSTPDAYGAWLRAACLYAMQADQVDERIVFVNAWNEWAEGAYLEPDRHFGYAYLRETARVLSTLERPDATRKTPEQRQKKKRMLVKQAAFAGAEFAERVGRALRRPWLGA